MAPASSASSLRRNLAAALLLLVAFSLAATLSPAEVERRARLLTRSLSGEPVSSRDQTGFWFDHEYAVFLEDIRRQTPPNATVAMVVPRWPDVYVYQAAYQLAPRRVVPEDRRSEASYVAAYRHQPGKPPDPKVTAVTNGALIRR